MFSTLPFIPSCDQSTVDRNPQLHNHTTSVAISWRQHYRAGKLIRNLDLINYLNIFKEYSIFVTKAQRNMPFDIHVACSVSHIAPGSELNLVVKHTLSGLKSLFYYLLTVGSWASYLTSFCFSFPI